MRRRWARWEVLNVAELEEHGMPCLRRHRNLICSVIAALLVSINQYTVNSMVQARVLLSQCRAWHFVGAQ